MRSKNNFSENWKMGFLTPLEDQKKASVIFLQQRVLLLLGAFIILSLLLLFRAGYIQLIRGEEYSFRSETNSIVVSYDQYPRGVIFDTHGVIVAGNKPTYKVSFVTYLLPKDAVDLADWKDTITNVLGVPIDELETILQVGKRYPFLEIDIKKDISLEEKLTLEGLLANLPGILINQYIVREYPTGPHMSHILGYVGQVDQADLDDSAGGSPDFQEMVGKTGVELAWDAILRGKQGVTLYESNAKGEKISVIKQDASVAGNTIVLSIDNNLQEKSQLLLANSLREYNASAGVVIVQQVHTGKLFALVSEPAFDNNIFVAGLDATAYAELLNDVSLPLFNRAISAEYPPGSLVKPFVGYAAINEGLITESSLLTDIPQVIEVGGAKFPDWRVSWGRAPLGSITVKEAIANSSNIFFYKVGGGYEGQEGLGVRRLAGYFTDFGLGIKTGYGTFSEASGLVPDPAWKLGAKNEPWFLGDDYQMSIGQGNMLVTPLQMINAVTMLVNGGKLLQPQVVQEIRTPEGVLIEKVDSIVREEISLNEDARNGVLTGMRLAVTDGIISGLKDLEVQVAAKTGTAEFGEINEKGEHETHAWIEGFAPYDNPEISFLVLLEKGGSSQNAANVAKQLLSWYFNGQDERDN